MTDTAKPTPGPWAVKDFQNNGHLNQREIIVDPTIGKFVVYGSESETMANANIIAEAGTIYHETGLTPRQLLEQRKKLLKLLMTGNPSPELINAVYEVLESKAEAARAKHGEDV